MASSKQNKDSFFSYLDSLIHHSKKHGRKHLPTFHHMWHAKMDVHLFKMIFAGLAVVIIGAVIIYAMNATTTTQTRTTGTKASTQQENVKEYKYYYPLYMKAWPMGDGSHWQWTTSVITNIHGTDVDVTVNIYDSQYNEGEFQKTPLQTINRKVKAHTTLNFFGSDDWLNLKKDGKVLPKALGAVEVISKGKPVTAFTRTFVKDQDKFDKGKTLYYDDDPFIYEDNAQSISYHPIYNADKATGDRRYKQFGDVVVFNPQDTQMSAYITVRDDNGEEVKKITKNVEPKGLWNSWNDKDWLSINVDGGWVEVLAFHGAESLGAESLPMVPLYRTRITDPQEKQAGKDSDYFSKVIAFDDQIMQPQDMAADHLYAPLYLKQWYESDKDRRQWSHIVVANPANVEVQAKVNLYRVTDIYEKKDDKPGEPFHSIDIAVPAKGVYNSYGDQKWYAVPDMELGPRDNVGHGWMEIVVQEPKERNNKLVAVNRMTFRRVQETAKPSHLDNFELFDDDYFVGKDELSTKHFVSMYLNNWPAADGLRQFGNTVVVNPHAEKLDLTMDIYDNVSGKRTKQIKKTIDGGQWFNGYTDKDWEGVPDTSKDFKGSYNWVEFNTPKPVFGMHRYRIEDPEKDGQDNVINQFDDDQGLFFSIQSIGGCTSNDDCPNGTCPTTSAVAFGITAHVCREGGGDLPDPEKPTTKPEDPPACENEDCTSDAECENVCGEGYRCDGYGGSEDELGVCVPSGSSACIKEDEVQRDFKEGGKVYGECCEGLEPVAVTLDGTLRCMPEEPKPACIEEDGVQRDIDGKELGSCCEGLTPQAVEYNGILRCVPEDPDPADGDGWYAPDGRACNNTNFSIYYEKVSCDPTGKIGYRTENINPQSECSKDGTGRCFITSEEPITFTSKTQRWLKGTSGDAMKCKSKTATETGLMFTDIIECSWKPKPVSDEPKITVNIVNEKGEAVTLPVCQGYWTMDSENDYVTGDYQNCDSVSTYTTGIRSFEGYHGAYINYPRVEDITPLAEATPADGFAIIDKDSKAPGIYVGWPKWEKGERTVKVVVYDDVSTESLSIEEIVADPVEGKRVETSGEITNVKEEEGIVYLLGQSDPIDVYFSDKSQMEKAVGAGGLSATVTGVIEIQGGTPIIRGDSITISE